MYRAAKWRGLCPCSGTAALGRRSAPRTVRPGKARVVPMPGAAPIPSPPRSGRGTVPVFSFASPQNGVEGWAGCPPLAGLVTSGRAAAPSTRRAGTPRSAARFRDPRALGVLLVVARARGWKRRPGTDTCGPRLGPPVLTLSPFCSHSNREERVSRPLGLLLVPLTRKD